MPQGAGAWQTWVTGSFLASLVLAVACSSPSGGSLDDSPTDPGPGDPSEDAGGIDAGALEDVVVSREDTSTTTPDAGCRATRAAGVNRYDTAARLSQLLHAAGAAAAVLVTDAVDSPDGVLAGPLAKKMNGPILYAANGGGTLPTETRAELVRLAVSTVHVIGGNARIPAAVEDDIRAARPGVNIVRYAGAERYATAAQVAAAVTATAPRVYLVNGGADSGGAHLINGALAGGVAGAQGVPVLLTTSGAPVPTATTNAITALGATTVILVGGTAAISQDVQDALSGSGLTVLRVAGIDRFETAAQLATDAVGRGVSAERVLLANGSSTADAVPAAAAGRPVLLSPTMSLSPSAQTVIAANSKEAILMGGEAALGAGVESSVCVSLRR